MEAAYRNLGPTYELFLTPENDYEKHLLENFMHKKDEHNSRAKWCKTCPKTTLIITREEVR